jgi:uncharacterized RDD family membrane protein YckC
MSGTAQQTQRWPGEHLGLPQKGQGSLALWRARVTGLVLDWAISMVVAWAIFGIGALRGQDWRAFTIMGVFFVQSTLLTAMNGSSIGQLITRVGVIRVDRQPMGFLRAAARQFMLCLVIPALVIGPDRRGLHDLACGSVVVNRR